MQPPNLQKNHSSLGKHTNPDFYNSLTPNGLPKIEEYNELDCTENLKEEEERAEDYYSSNQGKTVNPKLSIPSFSAKSFQIGIKKFTKPQVDELINELYESKVQADLKSLTSRNVRKSMETHLNDLFMNRFGLKKVVSENMICFMQSLKVYSFEDAKIRTFLHILKNECEEEFVYVLKSVEKTITVLLKVREGLIRAFSERQQSLLYRRQNQRPAPQEATVLCGPIGGIHDHRVPVQQDGLSGDNVANRPVHRLHGAPRGRDVTTGKGRLTRKERYSKQEEQRHRRIPFKAFLDLLIGYLLEAHLEYLRPLVEAYRCIDEQNTGYIDEVDSR